MADHPPTDQLHRLPTDEDLGRLKWSTVLYYLHETNPDNGLDLDKTDPAAPCSIGAVGLALANNQPRRLSRSQVVPEVGGVRHPRPPADRMW